MEEKFTIWIDRLGEDKIQKINGSFSPIFLGIEENELEFRSPVQVQGKAYLADEELIIQLSASTKATLPCGICNKMTDCKLEITNFYHAQPIGEIKGGLFDFSEPLREALLLELPNYVECTEGNCPARATMTPYLRSQSRNDGQTFPFADL